MEQKKTMPKKGEALRCEVWLIATLLFQKNVLLLW